MTRSDIIRQVPYRPSRLKAMGLFLMACGGAAVWTYFALYADQPVNIHGIRLTAAQFRLLLQILAPLPTLGLVALALLLFRTFTRTQRVAFTHDSIIVPAPSRIGLSGKEIEIPFEDIVSVSVERSRTFSFVTIIHRAGSVALHATMFPRRRDFDTVAALTSVLQAERSETAASCPDPVQDSDVDKRVAVSLPFHLHYKLNRRQRLVSHLFVWLPCLPGLLLSVGGSVYLTVAVSIWCFPLIMIALWFVRRFVTGLVDVVRVPVRQMDVVVERDRLGVLVGDDRFWLPLDRILYVSRPARDTWTVFHHSGAVINIPDSAISVDQIKYLNSLVPPRRSPSQVPSISAENDASSA